MKTKIWMTTVLTILLGLNAMTQEKARKNYLWSYEGKNKTHTLGMYGGLSGTYSTFSDQPAMWLNGKAGLVFDGRWAIGFAGSAINYDHELDELVDDGTYRLQAGYSGLFVEHIVPIKDWAKFSVSWTTGMGLAFYQYNREFRENRPWYNEYIDVERFAANEFGAEFMVRLAGNWWIGAKGSYRDTSPVKLEGVDEDAFEKLNAGITVRYGIF